jgi:hypothetical protein
MNQDRVGSGSEPTWTRQIPSWAVCDWFYLFFIVNVFVLVMLVLSAFYTMFSSAVPRSVRLFDLLKLILNMLVSGTSTLFFYIMCDRALKPL